MTDTNKPIATLSGVYKPSSKPRTTFGLCIYGPSGSGKTTLLGTMPGKGLVIDVPQAEGGDFVLSDQADHIDVISVQKWDEIDRIFFFLKNEYHDYKWVGVDSLTAMTELAKRKVIAERDLAADPAKITLQEWGQLNQHVIELIYRFQTLPIHVIWIAQETTHKEDGENSPVRVGPDTRTKALNSLIPAMMLVARTSVEASFDGTYQHRVRIGPHPIFMTKARHKPGLDVPDVIINANLGNLLRYLFGMPGATPPDRIDEMQVFGIIQ